MRALITGVTGQDGSYLAEQLLDAGHEVFGLTRRANARSRAQLVAGDLLDQESLEHALVNVEPDVVFNLAAVTSPGGAWAVPQPPLLAEVTGLGVLRLLNALVAFTPEVKLVHASSSAIHDPDRYGVYGLAKRFAHDAVVGYRGKLWTANAVLYSHTSPRQDPRFLARRICTTLRRGETLTLGDVDSRRDWGYAPDYTRALARIAAQDKPGDYVVATGATHSVREFTETALTHLSRDWGEAVRLDRTPPRVPDEIASDLPSVRELGWEPETSFTDMVAVLCDGGGR